LRLILIFIPLFILAKEDWFITKLEYGKMLYHNPRGISCAKCHGENAKGKIIAKYYILKNNKKILKSIKAPDITNVDYETFVKKLFHKKLSVMPKYNYLTKDEINTLYFYIQTLRNKK